MPRRPGEVFRCSCGETCIAARTRTGAVAPIVTRPVGEGGNVALVRAGGEPFAWTLSKAALKEAREQGVDLRLNHFADCPNRANFERGTDG